MLKYITLYIKQLWYYYVPYTNDLNRIIDGLYLSSLHSASDIKLLKHEGITHIINASDVENIAPNDFKYYRVQVEDIPTANIAQYFADTSQFIEDALNDGGKVLVHCMAGVSRSPTIIIAYLVSKRGLTLEQATSLLRSQRSFINPNSGFNLQLQGTKVPSSTLQ